MQESNTSNGGTRNTQKSIAIVGDDTSALFRAARLRLDLAVKLAALTNNIGPVVDINRAMPEQARPEIPTGKSNHCSCGKRISSNKLRCLSCQESFLSGISRSVGAPYETKSPETSEV